MQSAIGKACTKCGITKLLSEFKLQKRKTGHYPTSWCRECLNEKSKLCMRERLKDPEVRARALEKDSARYQRLKDDPAFREKQRERSRIYCAKPEVKERATQRSREWAAANPERAKENRENWNSANRDKLRDYTKKYREKNRDIYLLSHSFTQRLRKWRMCNQGTGLFTKLQSELCYAFWGGKCAYCSSELPVCLPGERPISFDHVIPLSLGGGHGPENIVTCCKACNDKKNKRLLPDDHLESLQTQIGIFIQHLPSESFWSKRSAVPLKVRMACFSARDAIFGLGKPIALPW